MVSAPDSGASSPGSSPDRGHCAVFFGKTLTVIITLFTCLLSTYFDLTKRDILPHPLLFLQLQRLLSLSSFSLRVFAVWRHPSFQQQMTSFPRFIRLILIP